ncbi:MAG: hypothetical protein WCH43_17020 [Verrucomicrobiota bacterium]
MKPLLGILPAPQQRLWPEFSQLHPHSFSQPSQLEPPAFGSGLAAAVAIVRTTRRHPIDCLVNHSPQNRSVSGMTGLLD